MINLFEVHVKDLAQWDTPEKIEELRINVSEALGLEINEEGVQDLMEDTESADRLRAVVQDPKVCAISRDL